MVVAKSSGGSFLVSPALGLMIWTLVLFLFTMWVLKRVAFPRIQEALDKRANAIRDNIEAAERQRREADELLKEYRHRLTEAREQADDIITRARKASEAAKAEAAEEGKQRREELVAAARRDIEAETRRSLERIRREVADLTVLATEKVTRKTLTGDDQKRLVEEALFEVARDKGKLDEIHEQLDEVADALAENRDLQLFLFSPYFSSAEKRDGITRAVTGAEPELTNFLELLAEKHRMPVIFRIRRRFDELWAKERRQLEVRLTSAVELPAEVVEEVGSQIERQTGQTIELESDVDESILGGLVLRVGNMVLDASVRNKLERLRKEVAQAA